MNADVKRFLAWLPMLGLAALAVRLLLVWDRLPLRMMSHFDAAGNPNGWSGRTEFAVTAFVILTPVFALLAIISDQLSRRKPFVGWFFLALNWVCAAITLTVFWSAIDANFYQTKLTVLPVWVFAAVALALLLGFGIGVDWRWWLSKRRREALQQYQGPVKLIAEESHGSPVFAVVFVAVAVAVIVFFAVLSAQRAQPLPVQIVLPLISFALLVTAFWAWRGFVYRFTNVSIDVVAVGIRLRRIPLSQIRSFSAEQVHPLTQFGGWGVKGFGTDTAYIWGGHTALHIKTYTGDVYLGHKNPEMLAAHLERIMSPTPH
jgi:Domain of unknown function (DUF1648)